MAGLLVSEFSSGASEKTVNAFPDECPRCHTHIEPVSRQSYRPRDTASKNFDAVFQCTNSSCGRLFIAMYRRVDSQAGGTKHVLAGTEPYYVVRKQFSEQIEAVSANFPDIYNEAMAAEAFGMRHIAGMGFGKALEFLVKDFAIKHNKDEEEEIKGALLSKCIKLYIKDENTKEVAEKAAWLRNDEAHYVRKWEDKDINDLKVLLALIVNAIENVELAAKYKREMSQHKS